MKQIHLTAILFYLFCFSGISYTKAQMWNKFNNIVKINSIFSDNEQEEGFGFVVYERNDSLYIITAKHVVYSEKEINIKIRFYNDSIDRRAELINWHPTLDIGMIKINIPNNYYAWEFRGSTKIPKVGDKIEIIGRYGNWMQMPKQMEGKITLCEENQFVADFYGAALGSSGGPVLSKNIIVGMIIEDLGGQIYAIPIQTIEKTFHEWLRLIPQSIKDLPIFGFGINLGGSSHQLTTNGSRYATMMDRSNEQLFFRPGVYVELIPLKKISILGEANYRRVFKTTNTDYSPDIQFKNKYFSYSVSLNYHFYNNLVNSAAIANMENPFYPIIILGFSRNSMNPKIKTEDSGWEVLEDQLGILPGYSKTLNSWFIGIGSNINSEFLNLKLEFIYERFSSKYLLMDIIDPLNSNTKNDWVVSINMKMGIIFRPKSSREKILR